MSGPKLVFRGIHPAVWVVAAFTLIVGIVSGSATDTLLLGCLVGMSAVAAVVLPFAVQHRRYPEKPDLPIARD